MNSMFQQMAPVTVSGWLMARSTLPAQNVKGIN